MPLMIREARPADADAMTAMHCLSWEVAYAGILPPEAIAFWNAKRPAMWKSILAGEHDNYLAILDGAPVGLLGLLSPCRDEDLFDAAEIDRLYLHPDHWGQGLGTRLMEFALATFRERGESAVVLWVLEKNLPARRFYEKWHFAPDGVARGFPDHEHVRELRYRLDL